MRDTSAKSAVGSLALGIAALALFTACTKDNTDAWGTFEAVETRVAAETPGRLILLKPAQGDQVAVGELVAQVDTSATTLQRGDLLARAAASRARMGEIDANMSVFDGQMEIAQRELDRTLRLKAAEAATAQQVDRALRDVTLLRDQRKALDATRAVVLNDVKAVEAQLSQVADRVKRGTVLSPTRGTVLTRFAEPGEMVAAGTPLLSIAALDTLTFRAFLSGDQLTSVHLGSPVFVRVDAGGGTLRTFPGSVTWIASTAEFTPTPIQTRKERTSQVYAIKVAVPNRDGVLRIGLPGELRFTADSLPQ